MVRCLLEEIFTCHMFISYSWLLHIFQFFALPSVCSNMCVHSRVCVCFTQYACIWATLNRLVFARCVIIRSKFTIYLAIRFDFICICCCCYFCVHILSALWFNHVVVRLLLQLHCHKFTIKRLRTFFYETHTHIRTFAFFITNTSISQIHALFAPPQRSPSFVYSSWCFFFILTHSSGTLLARSHYCQFWHIFGGLK